MFQEPLQSELDPALAPSTARSRVLVGGILAISLVLLWHLLA